MSTKNDNKPFGMGGILMAVVAIILLVVLLNPGLVSGETGSKMQELVNSHFLIDGSGAITIAHILTLLVSVCALIVIYLVIKLILWLIGKASPRAATVCNLLAALLKYVAVIVGIVWGLSILGVNTTAVLAGVGIIGLILGFGAQSLIEDIITGLFIIFEGQYSIGDIIILGDFRGIVREIGVRTTTIEDMGGNLKVVNNSDIRNFQNRSKKLSLAICEVNVDYSTDIERMETVLATAFPKMFAEHKDLYLAPPRLLGVEELGDNGMKLKIAVNCTEEKFFAAKRMLTRDVRVLFAKAGIKIPFPQVVVHQGE